MVLPCSLSMCFFCPFSILITLLGEEGAGLCAYCLLAMHTLICVTFSLPPGVGGWLRLLLVALPGLLCLPFCFKRYAFVRNQADQGHDDAA